ncbi:DNA-directed RNA polymerase subunit beta [Microbacterium sp. NPDC089189]|uniref:DNA-directed RNA polymerase subunit beta n=1 Tax=Microbacterium sp. NPDC089189 TaxID=3154972 RepID=UPI00341F90C6
MKDDSRHFHKPIRRPAELFDRLFSGDDPAEVSRVAHSTASALLARVRQNPDAEVVDRLVTFQAAHGIDDLAELWSRAPARSLPGALWRLYLLQAMIHDDAQTAALLYDRGRTSLSSIDEVVAGAPAPAGPEELVALIDMIMRGLFEGDFAIALERAAAFCRITATGATHLADDYEISEPQRASTFTTRALRLATYADDLMASASLWRRDALT